MALLLNVTYAEKDEAKSLGARWNPDLKKWYVPHKKDYYKFQEWFLREHSGCTHVLCDHFYLIEGKQACFRCKSETKVIAFGIENYFIFDGHSDYDYYESEINIASYIEPLPEKLMDYIQSKYNYKERYSKTTKSSYLANCCDNCDVLQGDFFLFSEPDSPFLITNEEKASNLILHKIELTNDLAAIVESSWGSLDYLIKELGQTQLIDLKL